MKLPKILRKKYWLNDYQQLDQETKKSSQQQAFDTLTPEEKLVILDETIVFNEVLKSVGLYFYSLDKEDRLLKEAIIQSIHKIESM